MRQGIVVAARQFLRPPKFEIQVAQCMSARCAGLAPVVHLRLGVGVTLCRQVACARVIRQGAVKIFAFVKMIAEHRCEFVKPVGIQLLEHFGNGQVQRAPVVAQQ